MASAVCSDLGFVRVSGCESGWSGDADLGLVAAGGVGVDLAGWLGLGGSGELNSELSGHFQTVLDLFAGVVVPVDHLCDAVLVLGRLTDQLAPLCGPELMGRDR